MVCTSRFVPLFVEQPDMQYLAARLVSSHIFGLSILVVAGVISTLAYASSQGSNFSALIRMGDAKAFYI